MLPCSLHINVPFGVNLEEKKTRINLSVSPSRVLPSFRHINLPIGVRFEKRINLSVSQSRFLRLHGTSKCHFCDEFKENSEKQIFGVTIPGTPCFRHIYAPFGVKFEKKTANRYVAITIPGTPCSWHINVPIGVKFRKTGVTISSTPCSRHNNAPFGVKFETKTCCCHNPGYSMRPAYHITIWWQC